MQTTIQKLKEKIKLFQKNLADYKNKNYDEYNTRADFIDFVFSAFGWDMYNEKGVIEQFREVIREDKIEIEGRKKAPDYSFRIGQQIIFYVEAKRPSVDIKNDPEPAYQLRRYAYTQGLKLSILTDFEEIAVYDTRVKPEPKDKAGIARIFYCTFNELFENTKLEGFETNFDFLFKTFSKQAILTGSFNQYAEKNKNKKGTEAVDKQFLNLLDTWRKNLAIRIALKNENLDEYHLNIAVQKIIDRLIFLRIAEDRLIEKANLLREIANESNIFGQLLNIFKKADKKYNSGLFISEEWLKNLSIEDKALKSIIEEMYYPKCPYEFSVLPLEILGQAYEQFLGKTIKYIRKTKYGHKVKIEEKPEVRKAGGVYYTPQYIVNYIVENTVGEKLKKKNSDEIAKLKILDPACGSGSFLIGAYDHILKYYLKFYLKNETRKKKALKDGVIYQTSKEKYKLSTGKKSEILVNNIYGVDIDNQAVEVTKLSLLLKVLEDENLEYREQLFKAEHHHLLPDLSNNIKCGNSLIGSDFYEDKNLSLFDNNEMRKINTFDWDKEFADIFKSGGFDCVIGNPPYLKEHTDTSQFHLVKYSILKKYYQGKMDLWYIFACKSIDLLKPNGLHSFIATNNWITSAGASILRKKIISETKIEKFVDFSDYKVFKTASIQTMVYVLKNEKQNKNYKVSYTKLVNKKISEAELMDRMNKDISKFRKEENFNFEWFNAIINPIELIDKTFTFINSEVNTIVTKIIYNSNYYLSKDSIGNGIDVLQDFVIEKHLNKFKDESVKKGDGVFIINNEEKNNLLLNENEFEIVKPYYTSENLLKYYGNNENKYWIIYSNTNVRNNINLYPNIKKHLNKYKNIMTSAFKPYGLHRARNEKYFKGIKIFSLRKTRNVSFTYTDFPCYVSRAFLVIKPENINLKYLTALLNSKLIQFWLYYKGKKQGDQLQIDKAPLLKIPLIKTENKNVENKLVSLVDQMLETQKKLHSAQTDSDKKFYKQKSNILDKQIDKLVYGLYELNDEDIGIIENSNN